jgi:cell division protein FtsQ
MIASLLAVATAAAGGVWLLYWSPWLRMERVSVSGTRVLTAHQVVEAADIPMNAPLLSVDMGAVAGRLRAGLPRIASVEVVRAWPDGIAVTVTERRPEVLLRTGRGYVEVDGGGVRFGSVRQPPGGVPVVHLEAGNSPSLRRFGADRLRREAVRVATALAEPVRRETRVIRVRSYDSITLELTGGRTVAWGSGEHSAVKSGALAALMKTARDARHFDVTAPRAPAVSGS